MDKKRLKEIISLNLLSRREFIQPILEEKIELICLNDVFFYRNSSKIRVSIENINFSKNLVIFFLPIAFLASRPNSANAQTRIQLQQEKTCRYFESQTEKPNFKKIILADLREPKNFISQQNEIFQFHEKNVNENLKLPLSKKQEGVFNPIKFSILAKNSKILCKNEKNSFVKSFYFFISWIFRNKILILSFGVGVLILTLVIYYGFHQNNVLNVQKNEIKIPALSQPKKLNFDSKKESDFNHIKSINSIGNKTESPDILMKSEKLIKKIKITKIENEKLESCSNKNFILQTEDALLAKNFEKFQKIKNHFLQFGELEFPNDFQYMEMAHLIRKEFDKQIQASIDWENRMKDFKNDCT